MTYGPLDHVFVALLALTAPLFAVWTYRRMIASLAAGDAGARTRSFRRAIGLELVDVAVILVLFAVAGRPVERLVRLDWLPQGWWTGAAWGVVLLACALLIAQVAAIRGNETGLSTARKRMTSSKASFPTRRASSSCSSLSRSRRGWARRSSSGAICWPISTAW